MFMCCLFFLMIRRPQRSTRTDTLFPYTTLFRSHDPAVVFDNPARFPGRMGEPGWFEGEGQKIETQAGRFMWETNFIADVLNFRLEGWEKRGGRSSNMRFALADGVIHLHTSEMAVGTYKKGRSEERRVGKECVSTCRYRWSPYH